MIHLLYFDMYHDWHMDYFDIVELEERMGWMRYDEQSLILSELPPQATIDTGNCPFKPEPRATQSD